MMKRKQHPTAVGYSPSASKDFGILHPAFFLKKKKKMITYLDISQLLKPPWAFLFGQHSLWLLYPQHNLFAVYSLRLFVFSIPQRQVV